MPGGNAQQKLRQSLTVIVPVFNEHARIAGTLEAAGAAVSNSCFDATFVVVDDGSTDGTAEAARTARLGHPVEIISQPNSGRVAARRAGLAAASGEFSLFLDSRTIMEADGLAFVCRRLAEGELVWNAHVTIDTDRNPYAKFWKVVTYVAWGEYLLRPRTTSFTASNFDAYPKGTTCFLAPTALLREGFAQLTSYFADMRYASDDTPTIRWIASRQPIHISPEFACEYTARTTLKGFARHAFARGTVFLDGHGRRESRFFPVVIAFYPLSLVALAISLRRPRLAARSAAGGVAAAAAAALARGFTPSEAASFALLAPIYTVAHGLGMWRGLAMAIAARVRPRRP
ncbi:MAG: glycosyltransferase family 2 protein [Candidatus Dormibacteraeota bacterium]|nr:glycosyltransferase family 2 protein [Candidatus Dormibacteraeota bacterium]